MIACDLLAHPARITVTASDECRPEGSAPGVVKAVDRQPWPTDGHVKRAALPRATVKEPAPGDETDALRNEIA